MGGVNNLQSVYTRGSKALILEELSRGGFGTVTWPGSSQISSIAAIPHGVVDGDGNPMFPKRAHVTAFASGFSAAAFSVAGFNAIYLFVQGSFETVSPSPGSIQDFYWTVFY